MVGAVVLAAGRSSRMGAFKPMLPLEGDSISRRVVKTLKKGGAERIVVVTGRNARELEAHLEGLDVRFVHNPLYQQTQMLDSVKLGLAPLLECCGRILITPVDAPLFAPETVKQLLAQECEIVIPVCGGKDGHPVCVGKNVAEEILRYNGEGGLRGALHSTAFDAARIEVADAGVLTDVDTPEDYQAVLQRLARTRIEYDS